MLNNISQNSWSKVRSDIQRTWSGLDSSALDKTNGDVSEICRLVADETGMSRQETERKLSDIVDRYEGAPQTSSSMSADSSSSSMRTGSSNADRPQPESQRAQTTGPSTREQRADDSQQTNQPSEDFTPSQNQSQTGNFQTNSNPSSGSMGRH